MHICTHGLRFICILLPVQYIILLVKYDSSTHVYSLSTVKVYACINIISIFLHGYEYIDVLTNMNTPLLHKIHSVSFRFIVF